MATGCKRTTHTAGFYRLLHNFSSADLHCSNSKKKSRLSVNTDVDAAVYSVERLVTDRPSRVHKVSYRHVLVTIVIVNNAGNVEYLVLWDGYSKESASWVDESDITETAIQ